MPAPRLGCLALAALVALPAVAEAQGRARQQARADIRRARSEALSPPEQPDPSAGLATPAVAEGEAPPAPAFAFDLLAPLAFNSNAEAARGGRAAAETTPELRLGWSQRPAAWPLRVSALLDASSDRFARRGHADADLAYGRLRLQSESGQDDQGWQGFVSYSPQLAAQPLFRRRVELRQDLNLGLDRQFNFDAGWRRLPPGPDSAARAAWSVDINAALQRRLRQGGASSFAVLVNPSLAWSHSPQWSGSLELDLTRRWYDREAGRRRRRDLLATPVLTVEFTPPEDWFAGRGLGAPVVNLQLFLARQASNQQDARFSQWGAGPVLRTGWKF